MKPDNLGPFEGLESDDGYRAQIVRMPNELSLHMVLEARGEPLTEPTQLLALPCTPENEGRVVRLLLLTEAIGRFLTTGGEWSELMDILTALQHGKAGAPSSMVYPGYYYRDGCLNGEGNYEHIFVSEQDPDAAILWVEGEHGFLEPRSWAELQAED